MAKQQQQQSGGRPRGPQTEQQRLFRDDSRLLKFIAKRCGCKVRDVVRHLCGRDLEGLYARVKSGERPELVHPAHRPELGGES